MTEQASKLSMVIAMSEDHAIGDKGDLLCHLSADLKNFKKITMGGAVIMGRKTFESLPNGALPGRRNIVISHNSSYMASYTQPVTSIDLAIALTDYEPKRFIIGGATIYAATLDRVDDIYLTLIHATFPEADTRLNELRIEDWDIESEEHHDADERNAYPFTFMHLVRKVK